MSSASDGSVVGYTYDDNGNPLTRTPGSNPASSFVFDAMNRVTKITHNFVGANGGAKIFNYTYDEVGNRSTVQREGGVADPLAYDKNSQLTSFSLAGAVTGLTYDASGNRTKVGSTTYAASNSLNQYTTVGGAPVTYGGNGNLKTYNGWTYTYDSMNRLTAADGPGGTYADFYYDGLGREVARGVSWTATRTISVYDGWERVAEYAAGGSTVLNRWVYGAGGDLVRSPLPQQIYYYPDASGSTSYLGNGSGLLLERYAYDLAGTPTFSNASGTVLPNLSAYGVNQLFTGQRWYDDLGLYDLRHRTYLPSLGRFLQPDPIGFAGDGANLYRYCGNNPVNWKDVLGLDPVSIAPRESFPMANLPKQPGVLAPDVPLNPSQAVAGFFDSFNQNVEFLRIVGRIEPEPTPFLIHFNNYPVPPPTSAATPEPPVLPEPGRMDMTQTVIYSRGEGGRCTIWKFRAAVSFQPELWEFSER